MKGFKTLLSEKLPDIEKQNAYFSSAKNIEELVQKMMLFNEKDLGNTIDLFSYRNQYDRIIKGQVNNADEFVHIVSSEPTGLFRRLKELLWDEMFSGMTETEQKELIYELSKTSNKEQKKAQIILTHLKIRQMKIKNKKK